MISKKNYLISLFIIILFISGCGYSPIYSSQSNSFRINNIEYTDNKINKKIVKSLKQISNNNSNNEIDLSISTNIEKRILSKNANGKAEKFELMIDLRVSYLSQDKSLSVNQTYNNFDNKFQLKEYEKIIESQLIDKLIDRLINYLSNLNDN